MNLNQLFNSDSGEQPFRFMQMTDQEMINKICNEGWNPVCLHILGQDLVNRLVLLIRLQDKEIKLLQSQLDHSHLDKEEL